MTQDPTVLLVTDSLALPASIVLWVLQEFQLNLTNGNTLAIVTQASTFGGNLVLKPCSLDAVISMAETTGFHSVEWLSEIAKALRPGGCLIVQECMGRRASTSHSIHPDIQAAAAAQAEAELHRKLLLGGFIGLKKSETLKDVESPEVFQITESKSSLSSLVAQPIWITAKKPAWDMGAIFVINKPVSIRDKEAVSAKAPRIDLHSDESTTKELDSATEDGAAIWTLETSNKFTDSDFIDEDSLLAEEDLESTQLAAGGDDCEVGNFGRKACKNCTCGRAELDEKRKLTPEQLNNPQSDCGNCGLGDAFRCNSCPYRGLPSFKLGEKITLSGSLQMVDA